MLPTKPRAAVLTAWDPSPVHSEQHFTKYLWGNMVAANLRIVSLNSEKQRLHSPVGGTLRSRRGVRKKGRYAGGVFRAKRAAQWVLKAREG